MSSGEVSEAATSTHAARYIRFRLTAIDTVQADTKTYPEATPASPNIPFLFRRSPFLGSHVPLHKVPEVRIWGATDRGQRCCVHIHGALPYVYIEYTGSLDPEAVQAYIRKLGRSLNLAMFYSFRGRKGRTDFDPQKDQYIPYIVLCKAVPFYGFHVGYRYFLKIYCLQPKFMWRLTEILKTGAVVKNSDETRKANGSSGAAAASLQDGCPVYEAHIPFLLQFMLDFNLYGCGWIELSSCMFRGNLPADSSDPSPPPHSSVPSSSATTLHTEGTVPSAMRFKEGEPRRISPHSALEFDCHVSEILNRLAVQPRDLHQDFTEFLDHPIPDDAKLVYSVKGVWDDERQRRKERGEKGPFEEVEASASQRRYQPGETPEWAMSKHFRPILESMLEEDKKRYMASHGGKWPPDFKTFVTKPTWDEWIPTSFQSVEALFPTTMERDEQRGKENPFGVWAVQGIGVQGSRRAESEDPLGGLDAAGLQELARKLERQRSSTAPPPGSPRSEDDRDLEPAHYVDENASEPEEEDDPLIDDDLLDNNISLYRSTRNTPAPGSEAEDERPLSSPMFDGPPSEVKSSSPAPTNPQDEAKKPASPQSEPHEPQPPLKIERTAVRGGPEQLSDIDFNTSDMFSSSPGWSLRRPPRPQAYSLPPATTSHTEQRAPRNLFSLKRRRSSLSTSPSSSETEDHSDWLDAAQQPAQRTGSLQNETSVPSYDRHQRAFTEPIYATDWSATQLESSTPARPLAAESSGTEHLSPTQILNSLPPADHREGKSPEVSSSQEQLADRRKRARFEDPSQPMAELEYKLSQTSSESRGTKTLSTPQSMESEKSDRVFKFAGQPPSVAELYGTMVDFGKHDGLRHRPMLQKRYQDPFYSNPAQVPRRAQEFAGSLFRIGGKGPKWLSHFPHDPGLLSHGLPRQLEPPKAASSRRWEFSIPPPTRQSCLEWLHTEEGASTSHKRAGAAFPSQIRGATQNNPYGFKFSQFKTVTSSSSREKEHMDVLALELQCASREDKLPDPDEDEILALFYCLYSDSDSKPVTEGARDGCLVGCITQSQWTNSPLATETLDKLGLGQYTIECVDTELEIINTFVDKVIAWDPEVLCGYEIQNASWGYLLERAQKEYDMSLIADLSRVIEQSTGRNEGKLDRWHYTKSSTIKITGRHVLPIWRLLKSDVNLLQYSFENVVFHILHIRTPHFSQQTLYSWMIDGVVSHLAHTFKYWLSRVEMDLALIEDAEVITNKTEFARIYGVDFASVMNRGSQFKVESVMFRIAKPESFLLLSPSRAEVGRQNALEAMPLIAEPKSAFYKDPVVVLDFQSLYPSVMIGYNYCYSTCLGRVGKFKGTPKFGVTNLYLPDGLLSLLQDQITISPNGFIFVKPVVRRSLLAKMLSELLSTRVMVKSSMKLIKNDKALTRIYNARQLGLKLLANVTYGYTSATFSGRMPCAEIADAIVQTGRESLERARKLIHEKAEWGADVVYGDTDSLFVWLPGKTKENAFSIGYDMADKVTSTNVTPVKLKFEKVYLPSVLASKKRYVGFKFESLDEEHATMDAKGIETIRRDGFPAVQKMLEASIRILFNTQDLSAVRAYCESQWSKFVVGSLSPQDFIFAKEVKLGSYSENGIPPPGAVIARNRQLRDHRDEVQYGERVPYIVPEAYGGQTRLVDRALEPQQFVESERFRIDARYYIKFTIAALNRVFTLLGVDTADWVAKMPKTYHIAESHGVAPATLSQMPVRGSRSGNKTTIDKFYRSDRCLSCNVALEDKTQELCFDCLDNPATASYRLMQIASLSDARRSDLQKICASCAGQPAIEASTCDSIVCPIYYARKMTDRAYSTSTNRVVERTWSLNELKALSRGL